ncbi:hypothetical protein MNBD_CHLOROFLEXI01-1986, partial [hydrothermal vent metagenome]
MRGNLVDGTIGEKKERKRTEMNERTKWQEMFRQTSNEISEWRAEHPQASFTNIENVVDEKLAKIRVCMIQELAMESELTDIK